MKNIEQMKQTVSKAIDDMNQEGGSNIVGYITTALHKAGYRKRSETVKEFAEELLNKINNGGWSEDDIYRQGQQAMAFWVTKYIADLVEQFGKGD